jgi:hypothetical protein
VRDDRAGCPSVVVMVLVAILIGAAVGMAIVATIRAVEFIIDIILG